jgi:hypothetical protein
LHDGGQKSIMVWPNNKENTMKKLWIKLTVKGIAFLRNASIKSLGYAIAAPTLLALIAYQNEIVPPATVIRDVAIYTIYFLIVAAATWAYARYIEHELYRA